MRLAVVLTLFALTGLEAHIGGADVPVIKDDLVQGKLTILTGRVVPGRPQLEIRGGVFCTPTPFWTTLHPPCPTKKPLPEMTRIAAIKDKLTVLSPKELVIEYRNIKDGASHITDIGLAVTDGDSYLFATTWCGCGDALSEVKSGHAIYLRLDDKALSGIKAAFVNSNSIILFALANKDKIPANYRLSFLRMKQ